MRLQLGTFKRALASLRVAFAAAALVGLSGSVSYALPILPGTTIPPIGEPEPAGAPVATSTTPFTAVTFSGTLKSSVYNDPGNPLGGLTFAYEFSTNDTSPHAIGRFTISSFASFLTDVSYQVPGPGTAPAFVDRASAGDVVGYTFFSA